MQVFILLFNARTENEGIHTIRQGDRNKILMFESEDDATRFALMLEAQDFPTPTVEAIEDEEVKEFCQDADYDWELILDGTLQLPPENNVESTDWQVDEKKSEKSDEMSESELEKIRRKLEGLL